MKHCTNLDSCGLVGVQLDTADFCTQCGKRLQDVDECICGREWDYKDVYCGGCGLDRDTADEELAERDMLDAQENLKHKEQ